VVIHPVELFEYPAFLPILTTIGQVTGGGFFLETAANLW